MDGRMRPWHYVLFVAAIGALAYSVYSSFSGGPEAVSDSVYLADVNTGEIFYARIPHSLPVPATNPDTGNGSLLPAKKVDGKWFLISHYSGAVDLSPVPPDAVDMASLEVRAKGDSPRTIPLRGDGKLNLERPEPKKGSPTRPEPAGRGD